MGNQPLELLTKRLTPTAKLPTKSHESDAGLDFYADKDVIIHPLCQMLINTGIAIKLPSGYCMVLFDRSGLSTKYGLHRLAGVIDENYTGEIRVCLCNVGTPKGDYATKVKINKGDKIIQGLLLPVPPVVIKEVDELPETDRGEKGFGSSDKK